MYNPNLEIAGFDQMSMVKTLQFLNFRINSEQVVSENRSIWVMLSLTQKNRQIVKKRAMSIIKIRTWTRSSRNTVKYQGNFK